MQQPYSTVNHVERNVTIALGLWFLVALVVGVSGVFYGVPAPAVGFTIGSLTTITLFSLFFIHPLRLWGMNVSLRWLVLYHTIRIIAGIGFLILYKRGALPDTFALVAGWGDILVGLAAILVAGMALPITNRSRWWIVLVWNIIGLLDILRVLGTALRLGFTHFDQVVVITAFPVSLLPTFIVPLILATHVLIFIRLWLARSHL